jgi:hypothetical protein
MSTNSPPAECVCGRCWFARPSPDPTNLGRGALTCYGNPPRSQGFLRSDGAVIAVTTRPTVAVDDPACSLFTPDMLPTT